MKDEDLKVVILHNIITPYKTILFNCLDEYIKNLIIIYIGETEHNRDWIINLEELKHNYEIIFKGCIENNGTAKQILETLKMLCKHDPQVLIIAGISYPAFIVGLFWAKMKRRKTILWSASTEYDRDRNWYKESIKKIIIRQFDAANVYGTKARDYLVKLGMANEKIKIIGNVTDNDYFYAVSRISETEKQRIKKEIGLNKKVMLYVGRFSYEKNLKLLIDSFVESQRQHNNDWCLWMVGNGPLKIELKKYINKRNADNIIKMTEFIQYKSIPKVYAVSDVLILPSVSEPWGLVVNEAMACGLPILVSKQCGCYPDLIREGLNGYSFDAFDKNDVKDKINKILNKPEEILRAMGEESRRIISNYTPGNAAKVVVKTIKEL